MNQIVAIDHFFHDTSSLSIFFKFHIYLVVRGDTRNIAQKIWQFVELKFEWMGIKPP